MQKRNTVDSWSREASTIAEQNFQAKAIIQQDWSRGGDGIVSLSSIKSIEDLKGHKIACTQFTPSHFLILYLLSQSGLSPADRADVEKNIIFTQDAPAAAATAARWYRRPRDPPFPLARCRQPPRRSSADRPRPSAAVSTARDGANPPRKSSSATCGHV